MRRRRLYLCHAQGRYGANVYAPLSVGCLWAYARTFPEIAAAYELVDFLYLKEPIAAALDRLDEPGLIGIAHYIWNAEWNKQFAAAVKERWPACVILVGGVQVPDESPRILDENPQFDFAIYGEGEGAFKDFLVEHAKDDPDYASVGSLVLRHRGAVRANPRRAFVPLEELRSPYLDGVFDDLWPREPRWQVLQEFDRGCPYLCSYCAWGQAAINELRLFPETRIRTEIEWLGQHRVDYLDQADANFGIVKRDVDLARHLAATKAHYGYPRTFRTSFAKNSNDTIWEIANILHAAGMLKSVTLALQSLDDGVLVNIKRKNIKIDKFGALVERYAEAGIPTYTELILGLPGETLDTFLTGIERCLEAGQHAGLFTYLNILLENTEQNTPGYIAAHGLETRDMEAMLTHGTPEPGIPRERQVIIVGTATMPHSEWRRAYLHGKVVEVFHAQGLLQGVARTLHAQGVRYRDFYGALLDWCLAHPETVAGREMTGIARVLDGALEGESWDCVDPRLGEISWPPEEFAFARICLDVDRFYEEIGDFLAPYPPVPIERVPTPGADTAAWARDTIWYGRKGAARTNTRRAS